MVDSRQKKSCWTIFEFKKFSKSLWMFFLTEWAMKVQSILFGCIVGARAALGRKTRGKNACFSTATWTRLTSSSRMNSATNFWGFVGGLENNSTTDEELLFHTTDLTRQKRRKETCRKFYHVRLYNAFRVSSASSTVLYCKERGKKSRHAWRLTMTDEKLHGNNALRLDVINPKMVGIVDDGAGLLQQLLQQWQREWAHQMPHMEHPAWGVASRRRSGAFSVRSRGGRLGDVFGR